MVFGCYALAKIGLGLIAFKDCSEDAMLLDQVSDGYRTSTRASAGVVRLRDVYDRILSYQGGMYVYFRPAS